MWGILTFVHIIVCVLMIMIILLQTGKGAEIGAAFGGGSSSTIFGSAGPVGFLNKLTTAVAIFFMLTSLFLALLAGRPPTTSLVDEAPQQEQEAPAVPAPVEEAE